MSTVSDRLAQLQKELDALQQQQTQEDFDEGARLHTEKNAPWVSGMYSHLKFPPYQYREYPRAMYHLGYAAAKREWDAAHSMIVAGNDLSRELAIREANREIDKFVCTVQNETEERALDGNWARTPPAAEAKRLALEAEMATAAGHLNYEDRNLTGPALAERELADELSDGHLTDVTETLKKARGRPKSAQPIGA